MHRRRALARLPLALLAAAPLLAAAAPFNEARYEVFLSAVPSANQPMQTRLAAGDLQRNVQNIATPGVPAAATVSGSAVTGTNQNGLGYANGIALARAQAGILKVMATSEAQAVARPDSNVGAGATVKSIAKFEDSVTFSTAAPVPQGLLVVAGTLNLTGGMFGNGGVGEVKVGGTGLSAFSDMSEWWFDSNGRVKKADGGFSYGWVPGTPMAIPFSITVYAGQATPLSFWLEGYSSNGGSFAPCQSSGGLCNVVELSATSMSVDYSHSLTWGGASATDYYGRAVPLSASSVSGFDYTAAAPVPEPASIALMLAGFGLIGMRLRRGSELKPG